MPCLLFPNQSIFSWHSLPFCSRTALQLTVTWFTLIPTSSSGTSEGRMEIQREAFECTTPSVSNWGALPRNHGRHHASVSHLQRLGAIKWDLKSHPRVFFWFTHLRLCLSRVPARTPTPTSNWVGRAYSDLASVWILCFPRWKSAQSLWDGTWQCQTWITVLTSRLSVSLYVQCVHNGNNNNSNSCSNNKIIIITKRWRLTTMSIHWVVIMCQAFIFVLHIHFLT